MNFKKIILFASSLCAFELFAQNFDIEQTAQLIRPRFRTESRYTFDSRFTDTAGLYNCFENAAGITFPIKRKFKTDISLNLSSLKLKDIFKNSIRIKAYEILGSIKISNKQLFLGFDSVKHRSVHYAAAGLTGLHLTKKYRIFFYSVNGIIHEEQSVISKFSPRLSSVIGQYHIRGLRKSFYYGFSMIYSDKLFVPIPFIGGSEPINNQFSFHYLLPAQVSLQYKQKNTFIIVGSKLDGQRFGINYGNIKSNLSYINAGGFVNFRHRFSKTFQIQIESGYLYYQNIRFDDAYKQINKYPLSNSFYVQFNLNVFLGKSLLEKIVDQVF